MVEAVEVSGGERSCRLLLAVSSELAGLLVINIIMLKKNQVLPRFELGLLDSKSKVIATTP